MERKTLEIKQRDGCELEAVIATLGVIDSDGDIIEPGALAGQTCAFIWSHQRDELPRGKARVHERGDEVVAEVEIIDGQTCDWLKLDAEGEPVQQFSWGFTIPEGGARVEQVDGQTVRIISKVDLHEVSGVLRGASVGTRTISVKADKSCACNAGSCNCDETPGARYLKELRLREKGLSRVKLSDPPDWLVDGIAAMCDEFRITMPAIKMFRKAGITERSDRYMQSDCEGYALPDESPPQIFVEAGHDPDETLWIGLHELAHVAGHTNENACDDLADRWLEGYFELPPEPQYLTQMAHPA